MNRLLVAVVVALLVAAVALWGASVLASSPAGSGLGALALVALAGVAGTIASSGLVRRGVGVLLVLAGALTAVVGSGASRGAMLLALLGALLLVAAGGVLGWRGPALPRMGGRFDAPGARRARSDTDRGLWDALDAGDDPTQR